MGSVDVRRFLVQTWFGSDGVLKAGEPKLAKEDAWDVNLAEVVRVNALAVPADRTITLPVMEHELRILTSFLTDHPGGPITMRHSEFRASAGHIKRFLSESLGLGMLTAAAERQHRWELNSDSLDHFDVLPAKWEGDYEKTGTRPDLLFYFATQGEEWRLAGEARGRSEKRPLKKSNKDQRERLGKIVAWSGRHDLHLVTMSYTYTGAERVQVDLFDIDDPDVGHLTEDDFPVEADRMVTSKRLVLESPQALRRQAISRVAQIADALYETAPPTARVPQRTIFGRNVRGNWTAADLLGPSDLRFFLGILDQPLEPEQAGNARRRRDARGAPDADPIQVAASGRMVVAVARAGTADPDWSEVRERLE
jgi:hypothetical protein